MSDDNSTTTSTAELSNDINAIVNLSTGAISKTSVTSDKTKKQNKTFEDSKLKDWEDSRLKDLLEEAYSYKNPRDKENKSEAFLQLLQKAENEKEDTSIAFPAFTSRYTRGTTASTNNSQKQGGSLQDVFEAVRTESLLDTEYNYNNIRNRRHNHNSRPKKYSSVSYRQREGGSLPSNVNVSNCSLSVYDHPFLNEVTKQSRSKNERTCSGTSCASVTSGTSSTVSTCGHDSLTISGCKEDTSFNNIAYGAVGVTNSGDTIIDIGDHADGINYWGEFSNLLTQDKLAQENNEQTEAGVELNCIKTQRPIMNPSSKVRYDYSYVDGKHYIEDTTSTFPTSERGKNFMDNSSLPLNENYKSCKSILTAEPDLFKNQQTPSSLLLNGKTLQRQFDINGNSFNVTCTATFNSQGKNKKKKSLSERNMTPLDVEKLDGYRGTAEIEDLVKYIENSKDSNTKLVDRKNNHKKKDKESDNSSEKDAKNKIKRSNSLEELRSCTKLDEESSVNSETIATDVILRNKGNKNKNLNTSNSTNSSPNEMTHSNKYHQQVLNSGSSINRKSERRSWGTEELSYLADTNVTEEKNKDKEKRKSKENSIDKKKLEKDETLIPIKVISMESIAPCESSAEFHVVTKKKKAKKRQNDDQLRPNAAFNNPNKRCSQQSQRKHQISLDLSNNRGAFLNTSCSNEKCRRKSTSSVPPSDKSESDDLDSVHSLPIESTSNRIRDTDQHLSEQQSQINAPQSYADIARTVKHNNVVNTSPGSDIPEKLLGVDKTVAIVKDSNNSLSGGNERKVKKQSKILNDFPDLYCEKNATTAVNFFNDAASSCSSTSSTSTIIKQVSYSQRVVSASEETQNSINFTQNTFSTFEPKQSLGLSKTSSSKNSHASTTKQTQQKLKNFESGSSHYYNSIEQYPALEKTVKQRHVVQNQNYASVITNSSSVAINEQSASNRNITVQQHHSPSLSKNSPLKSTSQQSSQSSIKNNFENIICNTASSLALTSNVLNNNKKATKLHNIKNTAAKSNDIPLLTSKLSLSSSFDKGLTNIVIDNTLSTSSLSRKSKKDKYESPKKGLTTSSNNNNTTKCDSTISNNKFLNRPAVIILNVDINSLSPANSDFTFGDFNENELRLFEDNSTTIVAENDSGSNFSNTINSQDENTSHTDLSAYNDQGYSSSANQSIETTTSNNCQIKGQKIESKIMVSTPAPIFNSKSKQNSNIDNIQKINFNETEFFSKVHTAPNDVCLNSECESSKGDMFAGQIDYGKTHLLQLNSLTSGPMLTSSTPMQSPPQLQPSLKTVASRSNESAVLFVPAQMLEVASASSPNSSNYNSSHQSSTNLDRKCINNNNNIQFLSHQIMLPSHQQILAPSTIITCSQVENELTKGMLQDGSNNNNTSSIAKCSNNNYNTGGRSIKTNEKPNLLYVPPPNTSEMSSYERSLVDFIASEWDKTFNELTTIFYNGCLNHTEESTKLNNNNIHL